MTPEEVGDLLTVVSGYDRRTVGESDVDAWYRVLDDLRVPNLGLTECIDAVIMHHQESTEFVMPAHILKRVKAARSSTIAKLMPPKQVDHGAYADVDRLWQPALRDAATRMRDRKAAVLAHPDLAKRLTEEPLNFPRPDQWNGGIPPETFNGEHNDSPRRVALVEIFDEATRRNAEPAA
jgi:hypothetical protein